MWEARRCSRRCCAGGEAAEVMAYGEAMRETRGARVEEERVRGEGRWERKGEGEKVRERRGKGGREERVRGIVRMGRERK